MKKIKTRNNFQIEIKKIIHRCHSSFECLPDPDELSNSMSNFDSDHTKADLN